MPATAVGHTLGIPPIVQPNETKRIFCQLNDTSRCLIPETMEHIMPSSEFHNIADKGISVARTQVDGKNDFFIFIRSSKWSQMLLRDFYIRRGLLDDYSQIFPQLHKAGEAFMYLNRGRSEACLRITEVGHEFDGLDPMVYRSCYIQLILLLECLHRVAQFTFGKFVPGSIRVTELETPCEMNFPMYRIPEITHVPHLIDYGRAGAMIRWEHIMGISGATSCVDLTTQPETGDVLADIFGLTRLMITYSPEDKKFYEDASTFFTGGKHELTEYPHMNRAFESANTVDDFLRFIGVEHIAIKRTEPCITFTNEEVFAAMPK